MLFALFYGFSSNIGQFFARYQDARLAMFFTTMFIGTCQSFVNVFAWFLNYQLFIRRIKGTIHVGAGLWTRLFIGMFTHLCRVIVYGDQLAMTTRCGLTIMTNRVMFIGDFFCFVGQKIIAQRPGHIHITCQVQVVTSTRFTFTQAKVYSIGMCTTLGNMGCVDRWGSSL